MEPKANSLTKLRDYLRQRKDTGRDARGPGEMPSLQDITSWRPKVLHRMCVRAKGGKKSNPIPLSLPGLIPIPLYDLVSV